MMEVYGKDLVKKAFDKVKRKRISNPKKSYHYVKGIVKSMAAEKNGI